MGNKKGKWTYLLVHMALVSDSDFVILIFFFHCWSKWNKIIIKYFHLIRHSPPDNLFLYVHNSNQKSCYLNLNKIIYKSNINQVFRITVDTTQALRHSSYCKLIRRYSPPVRTLVYWSWRCSSLVGVGCCGSVGLTAVLPERVPREEALISSIQLFMCVNVPREDYLPALDNPVNNKL